MRILQRKKVKGASRVRSFPGISFRIKFISKLLNMIPENLSYHQKKIAITFYKLGRGDHKYTIGEMMRYSESTIVYINKFGQSIVKVI